MKIKLLLVICMFVFLFTACGAKTSESNSNSAAEISSTLESANTGAPANKDSEVSSPVSTGELPSTVEVTLPASFFKDSSQAEIESAAKESGIQKVNFNDDGSVTYTMSKSKHTELLNEVKASLDETITKLLADKETYPSFIDVTYNDDLTEFTVLCDKTKYGPLDSMVSIAFYVQGVYYQELNGVDSASARTIVNFVDKSSGEIINTADSSKIGAADSKEPSPAAEPQSTAVSADTSKKSPAKAPVKAQAKKDYSDWVPYDTDDPKLLARNLSNGNVVYYNGQYLCSPEYFDMISNENVVYDVDVANDKSNSTDTDNSDILDPDSEYIIIDGTNE